MGTKFQTALQGAKNSFLKRTETNANRDDFLFRKTISDGYYSTVYLAYNISDANHYAVKALEKQKLAAHNLTERAYNEKQLLMIFNHPFVMSCSYCFEDESCLYLAMPIVNGGDLYGYIMWSGQKPDENISKFFTAQVVLALEYLHNQGIIHRDIKPENILLDCTGFIKIADFGLCSSKKDRNFTICGNGDYMAPEMFSGAGYGKSVDFWALGILTYELSSFRLPFNGENPTADSIVIYERQIAGQAFSPYLKSLIFRLLDVNPQTRIGTGGVGDLKTHQWFDEIDFDRLLEKNCKAPYIPKPLNLGELQIRQLKGSDVPNVFENF
ncbi:S_TK_X [Nesidiocoris tenuis]|uniref:S_TK_X n=1 Tax=Nesidiocoris tenuis TaxID=355587 RepID=A0ABN7AZB4_9HEMI|nr:S_TK_X [Nesidiocoris tenuis]